MKEPKQKAAGFVFSNTGSIEECYTDCRMKTARIENAGFSWINNGTIMQCFSKGIVRKYKKTDDKKKDGLLKDGFCAYNKGEIQQSFFVVPKEKDIEKYRDRNSAVVAADSTWNEIREKYGMKEQLYKADDIWDVHFDKDFLLHATETEEVKETANKKEIIEINSVEELVSMSEAVNMGDEQAASAHYVLTRDLDLKGKLIQPIGKEIITPFTGTFDGQGHKIEGVIMKNAGNSMLGFFGYIKGAIVKNLSVDIMIKAKRCSIVAAFCAINEGTISGCEAVCDITGGKNVGSFVNQNKGTISVCNVYAQSRALFWTWPFFLLPTLMFVGNVAVFYPEPLPTFVPVNIDSSIIPNDEVVDTVRNNENKASFEMPKLIEFDEKSLTAHSATYLIKNPSRGANYDFVAKIYLMDTNGKKVKIYESGRIPTGYHIKEVTLTPPQNVSLQHGIYEATVQFEFYHHDTGEKGMLDSSIPLKIMIY